MSFNINWQLIKTFKCIEVSLNHFNVKHFLLLFYSFPVLFVSRAFFFSSSCLLFHAHRNKNQYQRIELNSMRETMRSEYRNGNMYICRKEYRKCERDDANAQAGIATMTLSTLLRISKSTETRDGELHTRYYSFSTNIPAAIPPVLTLSLSVSLRPPPYYPPSLILLGPADGFPHAHVPRGRPGEIMNETRTGKERRDRMCFTSVIFSFPTLAQVRPRALAITSIMKGMGCTEFYYR